MYSSCVYVYAYNAYRNEIYVRFNQYIIIMSWKIETALESVDANAHVTASAVIKNSYVRILVERRMEKYMCDFSGSENSESQ